jgi:PAS domain S-box-containing protein
MDGVDDEMRKVEIALQALASSPALGSRDFEAFRLQALEVVKRGFSESVVLVDGNGQQLMNSSAPPSKPLPRIPDEALVKTLTGVLASGKTAVSSLFLGPVQKKPLAMVTVAVNNPVVAVAVAKPDDVPLTPFVLAGVKLPSKLQDILVRQQLPPGWTVAVLDGSGAIVARSKGIDKMLGKPAGPDVLRFLALGIDVVNEGKMRDGTPALLMVTRSTYSDWSVAVGVPLADLNQELRRPFRWILGWTLAIVLLSITLAWVIGGRLAGSITRLRNSAVQLEAGQVTGAPQLSFREANELGLAISKASTAIVATTDSLKESENRMRGILASAKDAIIAFDDEQSVLIFNNAAAEMLGWSESEALGMRVTAFIPERFHDRHYDYLRTHRLSAQAFAEAVGLRRTGAEFPVEISYSNVVQPSGILHTLIIRDITARLASVEALKRSNYDLQQFAYVASHDLKTPLRSISGFTQLLERKYAHNFEEGAQSLIKRTQAATQRLEQLTDDLLAFARVNSDVTPLVRLDLKEVAVEVTQLLDAAIRETGAIVVVQDLPEVRGNRNQLVQLLLNLVGNALKYCKDRPPVIRISATGQGVDWVVSVEDNGIGIEPKHFDRIFEVFKRLHSQNEYSGTGIGLAVCRRVVHHHGGKIWLTSTLGQGSIFYFTIPAIILEGAGL